MMRQILPPAESSNRLPILVDEIRKAHADVRSAVAQSIRKAIEAGSALIEAKELVPHGAWLPWLQENCDLSERSAQRYMRLARHKDDFKNDTVSDLTIRDALRILDAKTDLQCALELEAEQEALRREVSDLSGALDSADLPELKYIIDRGTEICARLFEIRLTAGRELGRLLSEKAGVVQAGYDELVGAQKAAL